MDAQIPPRTRLQARRPPGRLGLRHELLAQRPAVHPRLHRGHVVARRPALRQATRSAGARVRGRSARPLPLHQLQSRHGRGPRRLAHVLAHRRGGAEGARRATLRLRALQRAALRRPLARRARGVCRVPLGEVRRRPRRDGRGVGFVVRLVRGRRRVREDRRERRARRRVAQVPRGGVRGRREARDRDDPRSRHRRPLLLPAARPLRRPRPRPRRGETLPGRDDPDRRRRPLGEPAPARTRRRQAARGRRDLLPELAREPPRQARAPLRDGARRHLLLQVGAPALRSESPQRGGPRAPLRALPVARPQPRRHAARGARGPDGRQARHRRRAGPLRPARPRHPARGARRRPLLTSHGAPRRGGRPALPRPRARSRARARRRRARARRRDLRGAAPRRAPRPLQGPRRRRRRRDLPRHAGHPPGLGRARRHADPRRRGDGARRIRTPVALGLPRHHARRGDRRRAAAAARRRGRAPTRRDLRRGLDGPRRPARRHARDR